MREQGNDTPRPFTGAAKKLLAATILFFIAGSLYAQNTKGDKPASGSPIFKFNKIRSKGKAHGDRAVTTDISGRRRIRTKNKSSASHVIYQNSNPVARQLGTKNGGDHSPQARFRSRVRSVSAQRASHNVYSQTGKYVHNPSRKPKKTQVSARPIRGNEIIRSTPSDNQRAWSGNLRGGKLKIKSASRPHVSRGRKNVYWGKFSKGERPKTKDLTGREVRTKNFHSPGVGARSADTIKVIKRRPGREGANYGPDRGGYSSISQQGRAWKGNISGGALRNRTARTRQNSGRFAGAPISQSRLKNFLNGNGFRSSSGAAGNGRLPVRQPGIGASGISKMIRRLTGNPYPGGGGGGNPGGFRGRKGMEAQSPGYSRGGSGFRGNVQPGGFPGSGVGGYRGDVKSNEVSPGLSRGGAGFSGRNKLQRPLKGGGSVSGGVFNNRGRSLNGRAPGGSWAMGKYRGNVSREELLPAFRNQGGGFSGDTRSQKPLKGGGSVSGKFFNNKGRALNGRAPAGSWAMGSFRGRVPREYVAPAFREGGLGYKGNIRSGRPERGGGSVSGQFLSNRGKAVTVRPPGRSWGIGSFKGRVRREDLDPAFKDGGVGYSGRIKSQRPLKGGGSVSGKFLNNGGRPIDVTPPGVRGRAIGNFRGDHRQDEVWTEIRRGVGGYKGDMKGKRPAKGGGSISGRLWNNDEKPLPVRPPSNAAGKAYGFSGNTKISGFRKGYVQSPHANEESIKKARPNPVTFDVGGLTTKESRRGYTQNPHANDESIKKLKPHSNTFQIGGLTTREKRRGYTQNPKANDESIKKLKPYPNTFEVGGLTTKEPRRGYTQNPHANDASVKKLRPHPSTFVIGGLTTRRESPEYAKNPSSNKNALRTLAPGKAYAQLKDYQGNIKMKRFAGGRYHPDAQFAHGNQDNVKSERSLKTNIKLIWARIFKKQDGQPESVKEKPHVPRYDRKEKDLWKALYD